MTSPRLPVLLFALSFGALASPLSAQDERSVRDWIGGCDNTRHCRAIGLAVGADDAAWTYLTFERDGAPDAAVERVRVMLERPHPADGDWHLLADGAPLFALPADTLECDGEGCYASTLVDPAQVAGVLAALRHADVIAVQRDGETLGRISLSGASAIMLWIDEQQQRLDTPTAMVRRGERPVATIAAPQVPVINAERGAWQAVAGEAAAPLFASARAGLVADSCDDPEFVPLDDMAWRHRDGRTMVALGCTAGAYNFGHRWLWQPAGSDTWAPIALELPRRTADEASADDDALLINADFDPETGVLGAYARARGLGDCGDVQRWQWDGRRFALESMQSMGECRGVQAEDWPRVHHARVAPDR